MPASDDDNNVFFYSNGPIPYLLHTMYLARLSDPDRTQAPADSLRLPVLSLNIHESAIVLVTILTNTPSSYHISPT